MLLHTLTAFDDVVDVCPLGDDLERPEDLSRAELEVFQDLVDRDIDSGWLK